MVKKLSKHGKSLVLELEPSLLALLNIDANTLLDISTDGEILLVAPVKDRKWRKAFQKALQVTYHKYNSALKRLGG